MNVTVRHIRQCGFCSRGARAFLLKHGFDWTTFVKQGVSAEELAKTGDAMAMKAIEVAANERR